MRRGAGEIGAAIAAGRQHHHMRAEAMERAVFEAPSEHAAARAVLIHNEIEREIFDEELGAAPQTLLIKRVNDGMAGAVGRRGRALGHLLAVVDRVTAEGAL